MHFFNKTVSLCILLTLVIACEKEIELDIPGAGESIVVEGAIENGQFPFFSLTTTLSLFDPNFSLDPSNYFISDATATLTTGSGRTVDMDAYCLGDLDSTLAQEIAKQFGITPEAANSICVYSTFELQGELGESYSLSIKTAEGQELSAETTIRQIVPVDSIWTVPEPSNPDSLRVLFAQFMEPEGLGNYYRYFTQTNNEPFYPGLFGSVTDDNIFNGQKVIAPFDKGYARGTEIEFETYGKFTIGDTVSFKLAHMDKAHFDFWRTVEDPGSAGGGLFSTPIQIQSNVNGGLGSFGGYASSVSTIIIE